MNRFQAGNLRQPGAAPSDGGLLPVSHQPSPSSTTPSPAGERGMSGRNAKDDSGQGPNRTALTKTTSNGLQPLLQRQQQGDSSAWRRSGASPSSLSVGQCLGDVGMAKDGSGDRLNTVTGDDVRRAYASLQNQPQKHRKNYEGNVPVGDHTGAGQQIVNQSPALSASLRDCVEPRDKMSSRDLAASHSLDFKSFGKAPAVPTGAPASPTRQRMVASTISLARANVALAPIEKNVELIKHKEKPRARTPEGIYAKNSASIKGTGQQSAEPRVVGMPTAEPAGFDLVALAREHLEEIMAPLPQAASLAVPPVEPTAIKLATGLGSWADETVAVGRLVDQDSRRMADERTGEAREEGDIRRTLERGMGMVVKTLPLGFLKDFGYLEEAQKRGLEKTTRVMERMTAVALLRAWKK